MGGDLANQSGTIIVSEEKVNNDGKPANKYANEKESDLTAASNSDLFNSPRASILSDCDKSAMTNYTFDTRMITGGFTGSPSALSGREAKSFKREMERQKNQRAEYQAKVE